MLYWSQLHTLMLSHGFQLWESHRKPNLPPGDTMPTALLWHMGWGGRVAGQGGLLAQRNRTRHCWGLSSPGSGVCPKALHATYGVPQLWGAALFGTPRKVDPMPALPGGRIPTHHGHGYAKTIEKPHSKKRNNGHGIRKRVLPIIKGFWKQNQPAKRFRNDVQEK